MRVLPIFILFLYISLPAFSQDNLLKNMQGLSQNGNQIYEISGYTITVVKNKAKFKEKDINKLKKKYGLKNITSEYSDETLGCENLVIEGTTIIEKDYPNVKAHQLCYILPYNEKELMVILFQTTGQRNDQLEQEFLKSYFDKELSQYVTDTNNWTAGRIDFVGRTIELGPACHWMSPHNVQCSGLGQMSWSTFDTLEDAQLNNNTYLSKRELEGGHFKVVSENDVNIEFEGIPTMAKRMVYKIKAPKFLIGGRNILITYYVVQKVRNTFVSCVLSHYANEEDDYELAPLLKEVISISNNNTEQ
ncbi:MAG TPA: hypothetical protein DIT04_09200 [Dysgonomonas sp.]|nr:hypothetical protein [Dysgonomonas sp.]